MNWENILKAKTIRGVRRFHPDEPRPPGHHWTSEIKDFDRELALDGWDEVYENGVLRMDKSSPVYFMARTMFRDIRQQIVSANSVEEWNNMRRDFRHHLMTILNDVFDSPNMPPEGGVKFVDKWLLQQGFGDGV